MTKWLPDVAPDDRTVDVAARALANRLDTVRYYLKQVARTGDVEDIHQLRVWSRRADAALSLYSELLAPREYQWFRKWLKRLRSGAGAVRDCDVFAQYVAESKQRWSAKLRAERRRGMKKIRGLFERLDEGRRLKRRTRQLVKCLAAEGAGSARFGDFARAKLAPLLATFFAADPSGTADDRAIHQFRILGKELRYAMELLASAFSPQFQGELYSQIGALQERLGHINDLSTAEVRLNEMLAATGKPNKVSILRRHLTETTEELSRARAEFRRWWTPDMHASLHAQFATFLQAPQQMVA
ncbi:MAG TPA: CHAD domain-containing protein [Gemmataceae bacterium]|jgi:CHAD domain-containing protein|nr:CHAD domain-containing protein [Gemmataceae bacterium]